MAVVFGRDVAVFIAVLVNHLLLRPAVSTFGSWWMYTVYMMKSSWEVVCSQISS